MSSRRATSGCPFLCQPWSLRRSTNACKTNSLTTSSGPPAIRTRSICCPCTARYVPSQPLDARVWADLCAVLTDPQQIAVALKRAQTGAWLPQELQARQATTSHAIAGVERQQERLLTAYLADILALPEFERKRRELEQKRASLQMQLHQLNALAQQRIELSKIASAVEAFCAQVRTGLDNATFAQKQILVELLVDQVVVTDDEVEIRYVVPISQNGARKPFCQLRLDYRGGVPQRLPVGRRRGSRARPLLPFL